jgi:outer membrane protein assembly factor BamB
MNKMIFYLILSILTILILQGCQEGVKFEKEQGYLWKVGLTETKLSISKPIIENDILYVGEFSGDLYALDLKSQKQLWMYSNKKLKVNGYELSDSVNNITVNGNELIVGTIYSISSFDKKTGKLKWKYRTQEWVTASPLIYNGVIYFGVDDGRFIALDEETGDLKWEIKTRNNMGIRSIPAQQDGIIYVYGNDGYLYAIDEASHKLLWDFKTNLAMKNWKDIGSYLLTSPIVEDGIVYFGSWDGYFYAVDKNTGQEKWRVNTGHGIYSLPTKVKDFIYISNSRGIIALDKKDGKVIWRFPSSYPTSLIYHKEILYYGSEEYLYAIDSQTGEQIWKLNTGDDYISEPYINNDTIYFSNWSGYLFAKIIVGTSLTNSKIGESQEKIEEATQIKKPLIDDTKGEESLSKVINEKVNSVSKTGEKINREKIKSNSRYSLSLTDALGKNYTVYIFSGSSP